MPSTLPATTRDTHCTAVATTQALLDALDYVGYSCSQNGTTIFPQAFYTFGNTGRNILRGPGFMNWDASIIKTWRIKERFRRQVRGEVFNVANHPNYSAGAVGEDLSDFSTLGRASATPDV
jgi:hypothetical protein